jgi:hypothetical protein
MVKFFALTLLSLLVASASASLGDHVEMDTDHTITRDLRGKKAGSRRSTTMTLKVTNLAYKQPFAPFFVMVHNEQATPTLFEFGSEASSSLATLAETGSPADLVAMYSGMDGVMSATVHAGPNFPLMAGDSTEITVTLTKDYPYVSLASMFINSNDGFVALNGGMLHSGATIYLDGLDAGTEENNEVCSNIPGPACSGISADNDRATGNAEGFVHVHRGIHGIADITAADYDWRNPMVKVEVM